MLRRNIRTPLKVIFGTKNIIDWLFRLSIQYVSQLLTVLNQKLNKTVILTCRCSMCIENESTGKYTCSHAPYTRFTSVYQVEDRMGTRHWYRNLNWLAIRFRSVGDRYQINRRMVANKSPTCLVTSCRAFAERFSTSSRIATLGFKNNTPHF